MPLLTYQYSTLTSPRKYAAEVEFNALSEKQEDRSRMFFRASLIKFISQKTLTAAINKFLE